MKIKGTRITNVKIDYDDKKNCTKPKRCKQCSAKTFYQDMQKCVNCGWSPNDKNKSKVFLGITKNQLFDAIDKIPVNRIKEND